VAAVFKVPLVLTPQPEGGYTVTSPVLPELLTEGDTVGEAVANVQDALEAVLELYEDQGREVPTHLRLDGEDAAISFEALVPA
jgi:antitoxin HicB